MGACKRPQPQVHDALMNLQVGGPREDQAAVGVGANEHGLGMHTLLVLPQGVLASICLATVWAEVQLRMACPFVCNQVLKAAELLLALVARVDLVPLGMPVKRLCTLHRHAANEAFQSRARLLTIVAFGNLRMLLHVVLEFGRLAEGLSTNLATKALVCKGVSCEFLPASKRLLAIRKAAHEWPLRLVVPQVPIQMCFPLVCPVATWNGAPEELQGCVRPHVLVIPCARWKDLPTVAHPLPRRLHWL